MPDTSDDIAAPRSDLRIVMEGLLRRLEWNDEIEPIDPHMVWRVRTRYSVHSLFFDCFLEVDEEMGWFHGYFYSPITPDNHLSEFIALANEINGKLTFGRFHVGPRLQFKHGVNLEGVAEPSLAALNVFRAASAALGKWHGRFVKLAIGDVGDEPDVASLSTPIGSGTRH